MQASCVAWILVVAAASAAPAHAEPQAAAMLSWSPLPDLPAPQGVAGPLAGTHGGAMILAGGANFPEPRWEAAKLWHADAWVLLNTGTGYRWQSAGRLDRPLAYAACASTPQGVVCLGGNDDRQTFAECFLLSWDPVAGRLQHRPLPPLPQPCAFGAAAVIGQTVYLAGGQRGAGLETAMNNFWRLELAAGGDAGSQLRWEVLPAWPGPPRALNLTVAQHNGFDQCIYVISGRRQIRGSGGESAIEPLSDVFEFNPSRFDARACDVQTGEYRGRGRYAQPWRRRADVPQSVMAGCAVAAGQSHIFVLSGDDGALLGRSDELREEHPGFPRRTWAYHTITDTWVSAGPSPANQVTAAAVLLDGRIILASGEVKPRVRTTAVWSIEPVTITRPFGAANFAVLIAYLLAMVAVGVYFAHTNKNTDDYFRGGQHVLWWAAGCSIFATMLSSITYMAIPAKAYAQDQVYLLGNLMIPVVAPIAVFLALPFFRRIDATSAYEYLELRFNRPVRLFASASFSLFHIFRMGIVMSLAGLALTTVSPFSPLECVLIMGGLSILYCTLGGVQAVIWTDTLQTIVLLGGGLLCFGLMIAGAEGSFGEVVRLAWQDGKLQVANWHADPTTASLALWVVILGGIGQNISSYTADQAVVQRYMTTPDARRAAGSIWAAALLAIPASLLFYGMGTGLYVFYKSHPEKLDPTFTTDQILPLFIAHEVPVGAAGLIVAGIFAAAQSTISTSMNSTATAIVTDFLRPWNVLSSERGYLRAARSLTLLFGLLGTLLGILFVSPEIRSLFDQFLKVVGLFMGVLGGLFALGVLTRRVGGLAAFLGALAGAGVMAALPVYTRINGYLYAAIGLTVCFVCGWLLGLIMPCRKDILGLTIYTVWDKTPPEAEKLREPNR